MKEKILKYLKPTLIVIAGLVLVFNFQVNIENKDYGYLNSNNKDTISVIDSLAVDTLVLDSVKIDTLVIEK
jgi:hypothetical protein